MSPSILLILSACVIAVDNEVVLIDKSIVDAETVLDERDFAQQPQMDTPINQTAMESRHRFEGDIGTN
jgi:hypothetical protein